ncbi:IS3 family transposase [Rhodococcus rhodochrous]|nr:IS3 family transposase [Rhodococcus rhodochrous]
MPIELLNRRKWKTHLQLANATFDYIEIFYNRQRRHSSLDYRTPIEHEFLSEENLIPVRDSSLKL